MRTFYSPQDDSEDPTICGIIPIRYAVATIQLITIFLLLASILVDSNTYIVVFCVTYMLISFVGFVFEQKVIMIVHFCMCVIGSIIPIGYTIITVISNIKQICSDKPTTPTTSLVFDIVMAIVFMIGFFFYTWMCLRLVRTVRYKTETLPEFDTTQGLFQFNADAYDGKERTNLLYPKL